MIPGEPEIIKCPSCGTHQQRETLISGNTCGATFYTDGKRVAPMLPEFPYFVKCPKCNCFFKINESVILEDSRHHNVPYVNFLTINEYQQAIRSGLINGSDDDTLSLRIALWRAFNDISRNGDEIEDKARYEENCRLILSEIDSNLDEDTNRLMCAELWRNIGEFDKCMKLLNDISTPDEFEAYISTISAACDTQQKHTLSV